MALACKADDLDNHNVRYDMWCLLYIIPFSTNLKLVISAELAMCGSDSHMPNYAPSPNPRGRPSIVLPVARVRELSKLGMTQEQAAHRLGCSHRTLSHLIATDPDIADAWRGGKAEAIEQASKTAWERGMAGSDVLLALWLKSHAQWGPKPALLNVNVNTQSGGPLIDAHITDLALDHSRLLDGPNPDDIPDAEIVE